MKFFAEQPHGDIAEEPYLGTDEAISGFGYGAVETKVGMLGGAALMAPLGYVASSQVETAERKIINGLKTAVQHTENKGGAMDVVRTPARWAMKALQAITNWSFETPKHALKHLPFGWGKYFEEGAAAASKSKIAAKMPYMVTAAGIGALAGFFISSAAGAVHGANIAHAGRTQHQRGKDEIKRLRGENKELASKYEALKEAHGATLEELAKAPAPSAATPAAAEPPAAPEQPAAEPKQFAKNVAQPTEDWAAQAKAAKDTPVEAVR